jgi:hypothetical protein
MPEIQSNPVEYGHCSISQKHHKLQLRFTTRKAGNKGRKEGTNERRKGGGNTSSKNM